MFDDVNRLFFLRIALVVIGLTFIFGIYTLGMLWPSGWVWGQGYSHYLMMIMGVYATLGVFLLIASRNPYAHKSLIWFTVESGYGAIMFVQAVSDTAGAVIWGDACTHSRCDHTRVDAADGDTCSGAADLISRRVKTRVNSERPPEAVFLFFADVRYFRKADIVVHCVRF
jgi:hypothetical protein